MQIVRRKRHSRFILLAGVALLTLIGRASAHEAVGAFVDALCERGYYDTAVAYLDSLKSARYVSDDAKQSLAYQQGVVRMKQAAASNDLGAKAKLYEAAAAKFKQFLATSPESEMAASASGRLATMEFEKARALAAKALMLPKGDREEKLTEARQVFEQAQTQLTATEKDFNTALENMPKLFAPEEEDKKQRKNELAADLAEIQLTGALIDYELSKTYEPGSENAKRHLNFAAQKFGKLYEDYRTREAGLIAHLWEGKCYQETGNRKKALAAYQDLLDVQASKSRELRSIRAKALRNAIEVWCQPEEKKYEEAISQGENWLSTDHLPQDDPDSLAVRYFIAIAHQKQMGTLGGKDPQRKQLQQTALKLARGVARQPGEFKDLATKLVTTLGGAKEADPDAPPKTFAAARDRGRESLEKMQAARTSREFALQMEDQEDLAAADKDEQEAKAEAAKFFKLALTLDPAGAKVEEINPVRYYACYFNYQEGNFVNAAVIGEYLAYHFPKTAEARQGARFALASWVTIYKNSRSPDKSFEIEKINRLAQYMANTWPDTDEAADAWGTLLEFAVQERKTDKVLEYLEHIPPDSPRRGASELKAGQSLWSSYLQKSRLPEDERPSPEELERTKNKAAEILEKGVERMKESEQVSATQVGAVLSLAQFQVDMGQPAKAIAWLENETVGPLKLLNESNEVVYANGKMPIEIYKLALRAYVAVDPPRLEDAEKVMNGLEKAVNDSGDARASEILTAIYVKLGQELKEQLEELRNSKNDKQLKAVSDGFQKFLSRIVGREKGNTWASLNWVAETFNSLGEGFDDGKSSEANRYYEEAIKAYQAILSRAESEPSFAPKPEAIEKVKLRMASCMRKIGRYDDAIKMIVDVLRPRPMNLTAQLVGAETYEAKGVVDKDAYGLAILGGGDRDKKGQSIIWGWAKIAKITMNNEKLSDTFHLARFKLVECRYQYAMHVENKDKEKEKAQRQKTLGAAKKDLSETYRLYPKLGGAARMQEYDRLLKQIQQALGEKKLGLEELRRKAEEASQAAQEETTN